MEYHVSGIIASLSQDSFLNTGFGWGTLWHYPDDMNGVIPVPLKRMTIFDPFNILLECGTLYKGNNEQYAQVTALVSHVGYGVMKARCVFITKFVNDYDMHE